MTSLPGPTQPRPAAHPAASEDDEDASRPPESVRYLVATWRAIVAAEILHQLLSFALVVADPAALRAASREMLAGAEGADEVSDTMLNLAVYGSAGVSALIGIAIQVILLVATFMVARRHSVAGGARRLLLFFAIYLVVRAVPVFALGAGATSAPLALVAVDGSLQLLSGVAAAAALVFNGREETVRWTDKPADKAAGRGTDADNG